MARQVTWAGRAFVETSTRQVTWAGQALVETVSAGGGATYTAEMSSNISVDISSQKISELQRLLRTNAQVDALLSAALAGAAVEYTAEMSSDIGVFSGDEKVADLLRQMLGDAEVNALLDAGLWRVFLAQLSETPIGTESLLDSVLSRYRELQQSSEVYSQIHTLLLYYKELSDSIGVASALEIVATSGIVATLSSSVVIAEELQTLKLLVRELTEDISVDATLYIRALQNRVAVLTDSIETNDSLQTLFAAIKKLDGAADVVSSISVSVELLRALEQNASVSSSIFIAQLLERALVTNIDVNASFTALLQQTLNVAIKILSSLEGNSAKMSLGSNDIQMSLERLDE